MSLLSPSGGLLYHCRALRHRGGLWAPFRNQVEHWLSSWIPAPQGRLVLMGPSAGHTLPWNWLSAFDEIHVVEPDPVARAWLKLRAHHTGTKLYALPGQHWLTGSPQDLISMGAHMQSLERPPVLFCNVLGQLALLRQDFHNDKPWRAAFRQSIEPLPWASYHDRASCHGPKKDAALQSSWETPDEMSLTDAATRLQWRFPLELEDHGTAGLLPPGPRAYALWPLTADSTHLIEWAQSLPNNEDASPKTQ